MGGLDTEISDTTTTVALEMAWFALVGDRPDRHPDQPALGGVGSASSAASTRTA